MLRLFFTIGVLFLGLAHASFAETIKPKELSLDDAILLAVRDNPSVQVAQLDHVLQRYALEVQQWQFHPHFALSATRTTTQNYSVTSGGSVTNNVTGVEPSVSLLTPYGTRATLTSTNNVTNHYNPGLSMQVVQPLMRGFGKPIVEAALYNAIDSEKISRLNVEGRLRDTVTNVINAYLDVVSAQSTLDIDQKALRRAETTVQQTKLFIKAGHKAGVELVTVQADVAGILTRIENDKNNLEQTRYALLTTIGLDPSTEVKFTNVNVAALIKKYHIPTLFESKQLILANDIQYQTDQITIQGTTKRSVQLAEDNTRWQLDLTVNKNVGNSVGGGLNSGLNSLTNGVNETNSAMLNLTVPIDDREAKNALASAKIGLREAEIALKQEKWGKETEVINGWNTIYSAERAYNFAINAESLQEQTYQVSYQKYSHGLVDSLELQSAQQQLIASQQTLEGDQISYLKSMVNLDLLIGNTLTTWNIKVRVE